MTKISRDEVLKIASASKIALQEDEVNAVVEQLEQVLTYAERVQQLPQHDQAGVVKKNSNIVRDDTVTNDSGRSLLSAAPKTAAYQFSVPRILEES